MTILGTSTRYVRDWASKGKPALVETTGTNNTYNLNGAGMVAQMLPSGAVQYMLYDGMRSARQLVDVSGSVIYAQTFDPYGGSYASAGAQATDYGYLGLFGLRQSPLLYYNGRWYHSGTGRLIQPQPGLPNPYVPIGLEMGPLAFALLVSPKLRRKKWGPVLLVVLVIVGMGMTLVACTPPSEPPSDPHAGWVEQLPMPPDLPSEYTDANQVSGSFTGEYRFTTIDWEGLGLVLFQTTELQGEDVEADSETKQAVLLAMDMVFRVFNTRKSPQEVADMVAGDGTMVTIIPVPGIGPWGEYSRGHDNFELIGANNDDTTYLSRQGIRTIIHEFGHGIDDSLTNSDIQTWSLQGGFDQCGWKLIAEDGDLGAWEYTGSTQIANGQGPASEYAITAEGSGNPPNPAEDFADSFASVVTGLNLKRGVIDLSGVDRSDMIGYFRGFGPVDDVRRDIILGILGY